MVKPIARKFGRKPFRPGVPLVHLAHYFRLKGMLALPPPPTSTDWTAKVPSWPMDGNDRLGDCVIACQAHAEQVFSAYGAGAQVLVSERDIEAGYFRQTGGADDGLNIADALRDWCSTALGSSKIQAFASIDARDLATVQVGAALFGGADCGVNLPANCFDAINAGRPWDDVSQAGEPSMGHCIWIAKYDATGPNYVTWGQLQPATWAWHQKYCDECYVLLSPEWLSRNPTPPQIAVADLLADFAALPPG